MLAKSIGLLEWLPQMLCAAAPVICICHLLFHTQSIGCLFIFPHSFGSVLSSMLYPQLLLIVSAKPQLFFYVDMLIFIWMWQTLMLCGSDVYFTETYWEKNINQQQYQHIGVLYRWSCDKEQQSSVLSFSPRGWLNVGEHSHKKTD